MFMFILVKKYSIFVFFLKIIHLKGVCHEIFDLQFFS